MLMTFLDRQRATLAWKCGGLEAAAMRVTLGPSAITLGGLLKHLAYAEGNWFGRWLHGADRDAPFDSVDWESHPDWEFESAAHNTPEELFALWRAAVKLSRERAALALANGDLDQIAKRVWPDGTAPSFRYIFITMIEEYGRHVGHADLIRESIDGLVGEDAPH